MDLSILPAVNATLNATAAILLLAGYMAIRRRQPRVHARFMLAAFSVSALFLISYLTYHYTVGHTVFGGVGWTRPVYFAVLITHVILATLVAPLAVFVLALGVGGRFARHRRWARRLLPVWFYVSLTGVLIYFMLYHWFA